MRYNLAIIRCLFHLETPPIKEHSPPQYLLQLNLGGITCPDGASTASAAAPPPRAHSLALFTAPPQRSCFVSLSLVSKAALAPGAAPLPRPPLFSFLWFCSQVSNFPTPLVSLWRFRRLRPSRSARPHHRLHSPAFKLGEGLVCVTSCFKHMKTDFLYGQSHDVSAGRDADANGGLDSLMC